MVGGGGSLNRFGLVLLVCRRFFSYDSGGGFGVVGGGLVEQGYASLMPECGACYADCWTSRLVVVGPPWRVSLDNPSCRTFFTETRVQWELLDYSNRARTVSNANRAYVTRRFQCYGFVTRRASANLPCYGLSLDTVALRLCLVHGENRRMRVLRCAEGEGRREGAYRVSRRALLRHSECVSVYAGARDDCSVRALGRVAEVAGGSRSGDDGAFAADGIGAARALQPGRNQFRDEYWQGGRSGNCGTYSYARAAAVGGGCEFRVGGGRDAGAAGDPGCDLGEDAGGDEIGCCSSLSPMSSFYENGRT